jgi:HPt (histidine-containing phosphotransfer) domain-containing protein
MSAAASRAPIDLAHLARYTGGEAQLDAELLDLFSRQCTVTVELLETLLGAPDGKAWRAATHSLKGAAASVGASGFADLAARAEAIDPSALPAEAATAVHALKDHCGLVSAFVEAYLAR